MPVLVFVIDFIFAAMLMILFVSQILIPLIMELPLFWLFSRAARDEVNRRGKEYFYSSSSAEENKTKQNQENNVKQ